MAHTMPSSSAVAVIIAAAAALTTLPLSSAGAAAAPLGRPNCNTTCGGVNVPYPFGMGPASCYAPGFNLTCDTTRPSRPPRLLLGNDSSFEVRDIRVEARTMRVSRPPVFIGATNISSSGKHGVWGGGGLGNVDVHQYFLPSDLNELVVTGCNLQATVRTKSLTDHRTVFVGSCSTFCYGDEYVGSREDITQFGYGYCNVPIRTYQTSYDVELRWMGDDGGGNGGGGGLHVPVYVLIAEKDTFGATWVSDLTWAAREGKKADQLEVPVILGWECHNDGSCNVTVDGVNGKCGTTADGGSRAVYWCDCNDGYEGNPYVTAGCHDIDECSRPELYPCFGDCLNKNGSFDCRCPRGFQGNATVRNGCVKSAKNTGVIIGLSVAGGPCLMLFILAGWLTYRKIKRNKAEKLKKKFFGQNRGQLLQQLVSHRSDIAERMIISLKELQKATNNFDPTRKLGGGGHGTVYKGILSDLHVVAIKKSNIVVQREIAEFINEVAILLQINHRNIVKLHGCCLETEVPLVAYEFISNGTLSDHLHSDSPRSTPWKDRLRIAGEVGKAIAYLHSAVSIPIIHRDIKSSNVLLDDALTAKVSDFGASRHIPIDQTGITATAVQGTIGYLDPMYYYTGQLSEKSDVYSFGVLLVELLTRKMPITYRSSGDKGLAAQFVSLFEEDNLVEILDPQVKEEGGTEVKEVAALAVSCIKLRGEERPTMREVEMALELLQKPKERVVDDLLVQRKDIEDYNVGSYPSAIISNIGSLELVTRQYSLEEFLLSARYPR